MPKDAKSYAPRISPSTWKQHQCTIKALFVDQNKTLSNVAEIMKMYGLHASESQYERQLKTWGIRKNRTRDEWRLITRTVGERRRQGKDSAVFVRGIKQPSERVSRELARSGYPRHIGFEYDLPGHIQVLTPPATPSRTDAPSGHTGTHYPVIAAAASFVYTYRASTKTFNWQFKTYEQSPISEYDPQLESWIHSMMEHLTSNILKQSGIAGPDYEWSICYRSPLESLSISSWESVGVTFEEWVTQGWDILFGDWGSEGDAVTLDLIGYGGFHIDGNGCGCAYVFQEAVFDTNRCYEM